MRRKVHPVNRPKIASWGRVVAGSAALALVLTACGSDSEEEPSGDAGASESESSESAAPEGDGTLTFGSLLPQTGSLAFLGPPEFAGVDLAVQEINEAGGVLGADVEHIRGDSGDGDSSNVANPETDRLLDAGADVIVGAAASGVSLTVIDRILNAGVVMFSPANTSTAFDEGDYAEPDLYFRTAPSDILQGAVMANLLLEEQKSNVAILARQDAYGETLAREVETNLTNAGSQVAATVFYGETTSTYDSQVSEIAGLNADALVLIGFEETARIIPQLIQAGSGPQDVDTYFVDGNTAGYGADSDNPLPPGTLAGTKGTLPGADAGDEFRDRLLEVDPDLNDFSYSGESYDAVVVSALAAIAAGSDSGEAVGSEIVNVTTGGEVCESFEDCAALLEDDPSTDIDYNGVSGPIELGETGSPTAASIGIWEYDEENNISAVDFIEGEI
jgi:ABC-type branched-subunit amino acid transport system substrate-binding protein